ncbi:carbohydrate-binding protein [Agaribacterium sp. ZY112]|uniref:carbohydrate-binding protein n=1 Tax=Agaribacterium sp. ZY112 TaxID=3233574 RepID=UPI003525429D
MSLSKSCLARSLLAACISSSLMPVAHAAKSTAWEGNFHNYRVEAEYYWNQEDTDAKSDDFNAGDPWSYKFKCDGSPWDLNTYWDKDGNSVTEQYEFPFMRLNSKWDESEAIVRDNTPAAQSFPLSDLDNSAGWTFKSELSDEFNSNTFDEFKSDGSANGKWLANNHTWGGREPAPFLPKNVRQESGRLKLSLKQEVESQVFGFLGANYFDGWSAATAMNVNPIRYGYFEVRSKVGVGSSAFWLYAQTLEDTRYIPGERGFSQGLVDHDLEIDVYEQGGRRPEWAQYYNMNTWVFEYQGDDHRIFSKNASGDSCGSAGWQGGDDLLPHANGLQNGGHWNAGIDFAADFHVYGLYWGPDEIRWYVDGKLVRSMANRYHHTPLYVLLDTETMPDWFGLPTPAELEHDHEVDYIRVWTTDELENYDGQGWRAIQPDGNPRYSMRVAAKDGDGFQGASAMNQPLDFLYQNSRPLDTPESYVGAASSGPSAYVPATSISFDSSKVQVLSERRLSPYRAPEDDVRYFYAHNGHVIDANFEPANATDKNIVWTSSDSSIATVTKSGMIMPTQVIDPETGSLTQIGSGTVILTGTHPDLPGQVFELEVELIEVGQEISLAMTSFSSTGRDEVVSEGYDAAAWGWGTKGFPAAVTDNTRGEFGVYSNIDFGEGGTFAFMLRAGTTVTEGTGVKVFIDDEEVLSEGLNRISGDWDSHYENWMQTTFSIPAGIHDVKIMSAGDAAWQWFGHSAQFLKLLDVSGGTQPLPSPSATPSTEPSPLVSEVPVPSPSPSPAEPSPSPSVTPSTEPSPLPSVTPSVEPSDTPTPGVSPLPYYSVVELEDFVNTGRAGAAVGGDTINGFNIYGPGINWNTSGDYAEYTVTFADSGVFSLTLDVASPMTGDLGVAISLNGVEVASSSIEPTGDWDLFDSQVISSGISIAAGTYTLRVQSEGSSVWQWNADKLTFNYVSPSEPSPVLPSPIGSSVPSPTPSPIASSNPGEPIVIEGEDFAETGGTQDGFTTRTFWGTTTFADHILTGGWADYTVTFPADGIYDLSFIASTKESADSAAKIYIDGVAVAQTDITGNNLNVFTERDITSGLAISAGEHTVRVEAVGSSLKWHWFFDKMTFTAQ